MTVSGCGGFGRPTEFMDGEGGGGGFRGDMLVLLLRSMAFLA